MAKLLPTDPPELERAVLELTAASFRNARKLQHAAVVILDQELWPGPSDVPPPSAAFFGERLAEQMAAAARIELPPAAPAPAALE